MSGSRPGLPGMLLELLGATWQMDAAVAGVAWFGSAPVAGFALADGTMALARAGWEGAGRLQPRDGGGVELVPASAPPPPVMRAGVHAGAALCLAPEAGGAVLVGGRDGAVGRVAVDGTVTRVVHGEGEPVEVLAGAAGGGLAFAAGPRVHLRAPDGAEQSHVLPARVTALAFDPAGATLAAAHAGGLALWSAEAGWRSLDTRDGPYRVLRWSPDGDLLVAGTTAGLRAWRWPGGEAVRVPGGPAAPGTLSFSADGALLVAAGGGRAAGWRLDPPGSEPVEFGVPSKVLVTRVACHPSRPEVALGYGSGAVLLCRPGADGVLLVRGPLGGAVTALAWSADGATLAVGADGGEIGLVAFPDLLFRSGAVAEEARA